MNIPLETDDGQRHFPPPISLVRSTPPSPSWLGSEIQETLKRLVTRRDLGTVFRSHRFRGTDADREAGSTWLTQRLGQPINIDRILTTNGTQSALLLALLATTRRRRVVAVEELGYYAFRTIATALDVSICAIAMDGDGMLPDALEDAIVKNNIAVVYLQPTVHNPTSHIMSLERRLELINVARRNGLEILEDDVYGFLPHNAPPPFGALAPDITWYATGPAKCVAPGLRIGYLIAPSANAAADAFSIVSTVTTWHVSPLVGEIAHDWIRRGIMNKIRDAVRAEVVARQAIAARILSGVDYISHSEAIFVWVKLPTGVNENSVIEQAKHAGVILRPGSMFWVAQHPRVDHIRIVLGSPETHADLHKALFALAPLLRTQTRFCAYA